MLRRLFFMLLLLGLSYGVYSQNLSGKILFALSGEGVPSAEIKVQPGNLTASTDSKGNFSIALSPNATYQYEIIFEGVVEYLDEVMVGSADISLGEIEISAVRQTDAADELDVISLTDDDLNSDGNQANVSTLLSSSRDVFINLAAFNLNAGRYAYRGLPFVGEFHLNNFKLNDLEDNRFSFSVIGGLNDVLRNQSNTFSLKPAGFGFGNIGLASNIDIRASSQWDQTRVSYAVSNRSYRNRIMFTHSTGVGEKGWAFSISGSRRWADEGFVKGTFYDGFSYYGAVSKVMDKTQLHLSIMGSPLKRGRSGASVQEMLDIADDNYYNSFWGYQQGEVRNSRVYDSHQPIAMFTLDHELNKSHKLTATAMYQTGHFGSSGLDWFNAPDPRPDYWRNLPSAIDNPETAAEVRDILANDESRRQIQWDQFYQINRASNVTVRDVDGIAGNDVTGALSNYVVQEQHFDVDKAGINLNLASAFSENFKLTTGLNYTAESNHNYVELLDLLGGDFYIDIDEFAQRDFPGDDDIVQNDLDRPNRLLQVGDRFAWDYDINVNKADLWSNANITIDRLELDLGVNLSNTQFYREGFTRNGKFPDNSIGKSETESFNTYGLKLGAIYALNGRNYVYANGYLATQAPFARNSFTSPRTRNQIVDNLTVEKRNSIEAGYILRYPSIKGRVAGFVNNINDQTFVRSFFLDAAMSSESAFVNYIVQNYDQRHAGIEAAVEFNLNKELRLGILSTVGQYLINSRPTAQITVDNSAEARDPELIYIQDYFSPGVPQQAHTIELNYNSPKFWFASLNVNYFGNTYIDVNPTRRTVGAVSPIVQSENPELFNEIIAQEKLPSAITADFFGGKSWKVNDYFIYLNVGVNNLLDKRDFRTGGFEQLRFDADGKDVSQFPPRYFYSFGRSYFISLTLRL